jgi:hypothetical protein
MTTLRMIQFVKASAAVLLLSLAGASASSSAATDAAPAFSLPTKVGANIDLAKHGNAADGSDL